MYTNLRKTIKVNKGLHHGHFSQKFPENVLKNYSVDLELSQIYIEKVSLQKISTIKVNLKLEY